jgi:small subunit ribosomal protein S8e
VYNASNNELVRTNTLVKNAVIQIDATPFRQWYEQHYGVVLGAKKAKAAPAKKDEKPAAEAAAADAKPAAAAAAAAAEGPKKQSDHLQRKISKRVKSRTIDHALEEQFTTGRLYAVIASRPGQSGRADGYVLEGKELEFYQKKINEKKGKKGTKE